MAGLMLTVWLPLKVTLYVRDHQLWQRAREVGRNRRARSSTDGDASEAVPARSRKTGATRSTSADSPPGPARGNPAGPT